VKKILFLYIIIFLEGYVVLSSELLAMRQIIPFVGSGTDTVSIIIAAVLMPLAFGYFAGGQFNRRDNLNRYQSVRSKLLNNIFIASLFLFFGLSYVFIEIFFHALDVVGIENRLIATSIYASLTLIVPVYLLAQTIPLISQYFAKEKLSEMTGKMLAFSTLGSFMGAVFCTIVLMSTIGVNNTVSVSIGTLILLYFMLAPKKLDIRPVFMAFLLIGTLMLNSNFMMRSLGIVENNQYNTITIKESNEGQTRLMTLNNNRSSMFSDKKILSQQTQSPKSIQYISYIEQRILSELELRETPSNILVIGAGGFTLGFYDDYNNYDFVDIDGSLKEVSEEYLLKQELEKNKEFYPIPARGFIRNALNKEKRYDLIVLDVFAGTTAIPDHLTTVEFFSDVKKLLAEDSVMVMNVVASSTFSNVFSQRIDNSLRAAFPHITRQLINNIDYWHRDPKKESNILYIYSHHNEESLQPYTDNLNTVYRDRFKAVN
jgi:spermidine synthase